MGEGKEEEVHAKNAKDAKGGEYHTKAPAGGGLKAKQLCLMARGKLGFFQEGLKVEEEFAHGGDDGAFVRLAAVA